MSAYGVGAEAMAFDADGKRKPSSSQTNVLETFVKWVPGEAITLYAGVLGIGAAQGELTGSETPEQLLERIDAGSPSWFLAGLAIAVVFVIIGATTSQRATELRSQGDRLSPVAVVVRSILVAVAFTIWTSALPGAWPYSWQIIRDMGAAYALLLVPIGAAFAWLGELLAGKTQV